jgi:hypothetical protein
MVSAIDAAKMLDLVGNPALQPIAAEANARLSAVLDKLEGMQR